MSISFLVTVHNETTSLGKLLTQLTEYNKLNGDCEIVVLDDFSDDPKTLEILNFHKDDIVWEKHSLNKKFGAHKQYGNTICTKDYIFQIDADEYFSDTLLYNLKGLTEHNKTVELFMIPRVNRIDDLQDFHIRKWGWRISTLPDVDGRLINWPDYQFRFYKNAPHVKWERDLHELIVGAEVATSLPNNDSSWALFHDKTIDQQEKQNMFYVTNFSQELNVRKG